MALKQEEKSWVWLKIGLFFAVVISAAYLTGMFSTLQFRLHDPLYGRSSEPLKNIIILAIDDASLQEIGRWPWDRKVFADLLSKLSEAKVVGIDIIFSESSNKESDKMLADAIASAGNVVLSVEYTFFEKQGDVTVGRNVLLPLPELRADAAGMGAINLVTDADGITRSANTNIKGDYQLFAEVVAESIVKTAIPKENRLLLNMLGQRGTFKTIPITDVLNARIDTAIFRDAIVFVGATAPDLHDDHLAPTSAGVPVPGVEIQASLVQMMLTKKYLSLEPAWLVVFLVFIASLGVSFLLSRFNAWIVAAACVLGLLAYLFVVVLLFQKGILVDMIFFPLAVVLSYGGNLVHLYRSERRQKARIIDAFSKYVAPEIIDELFKHPEKLKLGGERRNMTIMFSDIRGFTTLSEKLSPEQLVAVLNEYLTAMTDIIMESRGVVDKYIGDAIMAFWGAPLEQKDHPVRACDASLAMIEKLQVLQKKWQSEGVPSFDIGVGINTGDAVVGNMGSNQRFDYTCMGDTVNLASRLEGLNKEYGTHILVSESTRKQLPDAFVARELDYVRVKGKKEPITIYELVGKGKIAEKTHKAITLFGTGLKKYRKTEFKKAIEDFEKAAELGDAPSKIYIERCEHFIKEHPGNAWDCVWVMKTK